MPDRSTQIRNRTQDARSPAPSPRQIAPELLRRREQHERAMAELDELLAALGGGRSATKRPVAPGRDEGQIGQRRVRRVPRPPREATASLDKIVAAVSDAYGVSIAELKSPSRVAGIVHPRVVAMFLIHELTGSSLMRIGSHFGGRDHSTVIHALRKARQARRTDPTIDRLLADLRP